MEQDRPQRDASSDPKDRPSNPEDVPAVHATDDEDERDDTKTPDETSPDSFPASDAPSW